METKVMTKRIKLVLRCVDRFEDPPEDEDCELEPDEFLGGDDVRGEVDGCSI